MNESGSSDTFVADLELGVVTTSEKDFNYPDPALEISLTNSLKRLIGSSTGTKPNVVIGAGSDQLLERLAFLFSNSEFTNILPLPAYFSHKEYLEKNGAMTKSFIYDLSNPSQSILEHLELNEFKNSGLLWRGAIWLTNLHNPTGKLLGLKELWSVTKVALNKRLFVILDEAYGEFADESPFSSSAVNLLDEFENIIVLRSLSKSTATAGIRVGYLMTSNPFLAECLRIYLPLFPCSRDSLEKALGLAKNYIKRTEEIRRISNMRKQVFLKNLKKTQKKLKDKGISLHFEEPGAITCMIWARNLSVNVVNLYQNLVDSGIRVMSLENIPGVPEKAIRVTMGAESDQQKFIQSLNV